MLGWLDQVNYSNTWMKNERAWPDYVPQCLDEKLKGQAHNLCSLYAFQLIIFRVDYSVCLETSDITVNSLLHLSVHKCLFWSSDYCKLLWKSSLYQTLFKRFRSLGLEQRGTVLSVCTILSISDKTVSDDDRWYCQVMCVPAVLLILYCRVSETLCRICIKCHYFNDKFGFPWFFIPQRFHANIKNSARCLEKRTKWCITIAA